jgi:hypothetical protein
VLWRDAGSTYPYGASRSHSLGTPLSRTLLDGGSARRRDLSMASLHIRQWHRPGVRTVTMEILLWVCQGHINSVVIITKCKVIGSVVMWSELTWFMWSDFVFKWSYGEVLGDKSTVYIRVTLYCGYFLVLWPFHLVCICTVVVLTCFAMCGCAYVWLFW